MYVIVYVALLVSLPRMCMYKYYHWGGGVDHSIYPYIVSSLGV